MRTRAPGHPKRKAEGEFCPGGFQRDRRGQGGLGVAGRPPSCRPQALWAAAALLDSRVPGTTWVAEAGNFSLSALSGEGAGGPLVAFPSRQPAVRAQGCRPWRPAAGPSHRSPQPVAWPSSGTTAVARGRPYGLRPLGRQAGLQ